MVLGSGRFSEDDMLERDSPSLKPSSGRFELLPRAECRRPRMEVVEVKVWCGEGWGWSSVVACAAEGEAVLCVPA